MAGYLGDLMKYSGYLACIAVGWLAAFAPASSQDSAPAGTEAQRSALERLSWMDGEWVGEANIRTASGEVIREIHTERIGPMLGGSIKIIEGRTPGHDTGAAAFNAFAVISWDVSNQRYVMRSYANGQVGDFPLVADASGFSWVIPAGPGEMRFQTTYSDGVWVETGDFVMPSRPPMRTIELRLTCRGDTTWPSGNPVEP